MSFCTERWIKKTRKPHHCCWCMQWIHAGARAYYMSGINPENDFWSGHFHPECKAALDSIPPRDMQEGFEYGEFARGRADDDRQLPPMFLPDYAGRVPVTTEAAS